MEQQKKRNRLISLVVSLLMLGTLMVPLNVQVASAASQPAKPKQVKNLVVNVADATSVKIRFGNVKNAKGYQIYQATKKKGNYKKIKALKQKRVKRLVFTKKKLKAGKRYYYKVRAYKVRKGKRIYGKFSKVKSVKLKKRKSSNKSKYCGYYTHYYVEGSQKAPLITVHIKKVSNGKVTFNVEKYGVNYSSIYAIETVTAKLKNKKASFKWRDSWDNRGTGTLIIGTKTIKLNLKQTKNGGFNRSTLDTGGTITLDKQ